MGGDTSPLLLLLLLLAEAAKIAAAAAVVCVDAWLRSRVGAGIVSV